MSFFYSGKMGIDAGHIIQQATKAKGLASMASDVDVKALLESYQARGILGRNATFQDALDMKQYLMHKRMGEVAAERAKRELQQQQEAEFLMKHPLSSPIKSKPELIKKCEGKTPAELLDALGITTQVLPGGKKELSHYKWAPYYYTFKTAGIDETKLLEGVESIKGECNLLASSLENLGEVKSVGKLVVPEFTSIKDLSGLKYVGQVVVGELSQTDAIEFLKKLNLDPNVIAKRFMGFYR